MLPIPDGLSVPSREGGVGCILSAAACTVFQAGARGSGVTGELAAQPEQARVGQRGYQPVSNIRYIQSLSFSILVSGWFFLLRKGYLRVTGELAAATRVGQSGSGGYCPMSDASFFQCPMSNVQCPMSNVQSSMWSDRGISNSPARAGQSGSVGLHVRYRQGI